jgi:hypothetical protein
MASEVVFIGGRSGVGKTNVGCEIHAQLSAAGIAHCVIDGDFSTWPTHRRGSTSSPNAISRRCGKTIGHFRYRRLIYINTVSVLTGVMDELAGAMGDDPAVFGILRAHHSITRPAPR